MQTFSVVFLGAPGSGKGTQAKKLAQSNSSWKHISTGDLFRAEMASGSDLGKAAEGIIAKGDLVSDDLTNQIFSSQLMGLVSSDEIPVCLLDGYPRTGAQSQFLRQLTSKEDSLGDIFLAEFDISLDVVIERLSGRLINPRNGMVYHEKWKVPKKSGICDIDGQELIKRPDDQKEVVAKRYDLFMNTRSEIVENLALEGSKHFKFDASQEPAQVGLQLERKLKEWAHL